MYEIIIENVLKDLNLDFEILEVLKNKMIIEFSNYNISKKETSIAVCTEDKETMALNRFFAIKKLDGLSMKSLVYYRNVLKFFRQSNICQWRVE